MVREWAQRDFGNRIGLDRVIRVLDRHNVRGTVALNSDVCVHMPEVVRACLAHGWELMGHGKTNTHRLNEVPPEEERVLVKEILDTIEGLSGTR
ncbi:polysaccharide deacetylase family protein, partial [Acuticoccus sp. 2012]